MSTACMVEIDTLWNVKTINRRENRMAGTVEIDTLWNVKFIIALISRSFMGRNRYIVECKEEWERIKGQFDARRNRYIVECKAVIFNIRVVRRAV